MSRDLQRVQKIIADCGFTSRRQAEQLIEQGRVTVNDKKIALGTKALASDEIRIDNKLLNSAAATTQPEVILLNKPEGYITTRSDPKNRKTVFQLLPKPKQGRWISIGRLDINTSGLLLFTTDGQLANKLMHPSAQIERDYLCRVYGDINSNKINRLKNGIKLNTENNISLFHTINIIESKGKNHWVRVVLLQGKYREVRRLWLAVGCQVSRLIRIRYGSIKLPDNLNKGHYQVLSTKRIQQLMHEPTV